MTLNEDAPTAMEVIPATAVSAISRAEIDIQVATAKRYPRDLQRVATDLLALACRDPETAASMFYVLRRDGKLIEGESIRLAEVVGYAYGNLRCGSRVVEVGDAEIRAQGFCFDLERNLAATVEVGRRITKSDGTRYSADMITVTGNAACSIALRNAILRVVPRAFIRPAYERAKELARGGAEPLAARCQRALWYFATLGVPQAAVLRLCEAASVEAMTEEHLTTLRGLRTALEDGETTVEDLMREGGGSWATGGRAPVPAPVLTLTPPPAPVPAAAPAPAAPIVQPAAARDKTGAVSAILLELQRIKLKRPVFEFLARKHANVDLQTIKGGDDAGLSAKLAQASEEELERLYTVLVGLTAPPKEPTAA